MGSKKKDLEIIYNLQWKNKPANGDDKANIIGMYDIPATTLNWEIFKSYLLKNSGTVGDDVKVSYITDSNREFPIESQTDFQIALYAFRRKARMGDVVNLKMDRISNQPTHRNIRHSNDVETQFDNNGAASLTSTCCNIDTPPDWFTSYMDQFKKNISDELRATVSSIVLNVQKIPVRDASYHHGRKSKPDCPKRGRRHSLLLGEPSHDTKDLIKSLKLEGKLERKLEKLEHKTKKIKEKKKALLTKSSDSDAGPSCSKSQGYFPSGKGDELQMDVTPVNAQTPRHLLGGEEILHQWVVRNTGKLPWSSKTSLKYTWGSKALKPMDHTIEIPFLNPGETGTIAVHLKVPRYPGNYECYYHFHHEGRRFGHWLGCQIIVDPFNTSNTSSVPTHQLDNFYDLHRIRIHDKDFDLQQALTDYAEIAHGQDNAIYTFNINRQYPEDETKPEEIIEDDETSAKNVLDQLVRDISTRVENVQLQEPTDTNCSSDSDNQSIVSLSDSESSKSLPEEFVVVPIPDCFKIDPIPSSSNENVQEENKATEDDIAIASAVVASNQEPEEIVRPSSEQVPDNYDDNNNTERTNQNACVSVNTSKVDDDTSCDGSQKSDIVVISLPNENDEINAGYAYVIIDGNKMQIPKKILKSEYLVAQSIPNVTRTNSVASSVEIVNKEDEIPQLESVPSEPRSSTPVPLIEPLANSSSTSEPNVSAESNYELLSHCSAAGSTFSEVNSTAEKNSRLFIFPQNCPGYEVVYPVLDVPENSGLGEYKWTDADAQYVLSTYSEYQNIPSTTLQSATSTSSPPLNLSTHDRNPFKASTTVHVPNYQQTPANMRTPPESTVNPASAAENITPPTTEPVVNASIPEPVRIPQNSAPIHILPETLVSGAVNVASSAINTARSVINMIVPREQPGRWVNGHWISNNPETPREGNLQALAEMGFWNRDLNATLLARYNDDLSRVVAELIQ